MATRTLTGATGVTALVVPLPTVWTVPSDGCRNQIYEGFRTISTSCVPPQFNGVWYSKGYYSPGVCPGSYTIGCTVTDVEGWTDLVTGVGGIPGQSISPGESAYYCVPSNYKCHDLAYATTSGGLTAPTSSDSLPYYLPAIQIRWQSSDLSILQAAPATGQLSSGTTSAAPGRSNVPIPGAGGGDGAQAGSPNDDSRGGLTTPALIGISVGVTLVVIAAISCLALWLRRRCVGQRRGTARELPPDPAALPAPPLGATAASTVELDSKVVFEADCETASSDMKASPRYEVVELPGHELDGDYGMQGTHELPGARGSRQ